jgi:hypothetical protein
MHPNAYMISKALSATASVNARGELAGESAALFCETRVVDDTLALVENSDQFHPTSCCLDGRVMPGYKKADDLLKLLGQEPPEPRSPA